MPSPRRPRLRTFIVLLGLAANLIAAGAPLLHVLLHELHEAGHHDEHGVALAFSAGPDTDHSGLEVHPQALHDDARLVKRDALVFAFPALAVAPPEPVEFEIEYLTSAPPGTLRSRAPPPGDPARAPPLL